MQKFLSDNGFIIDKPVGDKITRYKSSDKGSGKPCWAMIFEDGLSGVWGDWRYDSSNYWRADGKKYEDLSTEQRAVAKINRDVAVKQLEQDRENYALINLEKWNNITTGTSCEYLDRKGVKNWGIKVGTDGNAYLPARDITGKFWNFQNISSSPKLFQHGKSGGCFHLIEGNRTQIVVCSGYATGATIHEVTGLCVIVCFGDGNVFEVAKILKDAKWQNLIVAVDNDCNTSHSGNKLGQKVKDVLGLPVVMPKRHGDFNDIKEDGIYGYFFEVTPAFNLGELLDDKTPMPEDVIYPRVLTQAGMLVFGGAPKVGKSDFMLSWLMHLAGGSEFMEMYPAKPLKIFYLQAEVQYDYLRERSQCVDIDKEVVSIARQNLIITPQLRMLLDEKGVQKVGNTIKHHFGSEKPDIIVIDPISNVYDGESENDNAQMMKFLCDRVEALRQYAKSETAFILVHHTKKISKEELAKDPFQMFSGASSLRRYYTSGMVMYRPDEEVSETVITYELRNGKALKNINVDKIDGRWFKIEKEQSRIAHKQEGKRNDSERERKIQTIKNFIETENAENRFYTKTDLASKLAGKFELGGRTTIIDLLTVMLAQEFLVTFSFLESPIKYLKN